MTSKYIVICRDEVFFNSDNLGYARRYIRDIRKEYPEHVELLLYEFKEEEK